MKEYDASIMLGAQFRDHIMRCFGIRLLTLMATAGSAGCLEPIAESETHATQIVENLEGIVVHEGKDPTKPIIEVRLPFSKVTDSDLRELKALKSLKRLNLDDTKITDAGLKYLANSKELEEITLTNTKVTDAGIKELIGLKKLKRLFLG